MMGFYAVTFWAISIGFLSKDFHNHSTQRNLKIHLTILAQLHFVIGDHRWGKWGKQGGGRLEATDLFHSVTEKKQDRKKHCRCWEGGKKGTNIPKVMEVGKWEQKHRHDKQAQQVMTIDCSFANGALDGHSGPQWNGNEPKRPTSMTMGGQGGDEAEY